MKKSSGQSSAGARPKASTSTSKPQNAPASSKPRGASKAVVPKGRQAVVPRNMPAPIPMKKVDGMLVPEGYTMREIKPAENYDVVSFAKAMNPDFAPRMKKLFDTETAAAVEAQKSGVYIGWRCPEFQHDCQRVHRTSRCFCDHSLEQHAHYDGYSVRVPCKQPGCKCKEYKWIPNKPEDIGEFWFQRRRDFDPAAWRAKCKCKHTHNFHDPNSPHRCKTKGCSCGGFYSDFLCAACDRHWEEHKTYFETEETREDKGLPVGTDWLPFAEMPNLRNIALSGDETDDSMYRRLTQGEGSIPRSRMITDNNSPVVMPSQQRGGGGAGGSGFRPIYD